MVRTRDSEKAFIPFVRIASDLAFSNTKSRVQDDSRLVAIPAPIPQPSTSEPIKGVRNIVQTLKGCRRAVRRGVRSVCALSCSDHLCRSGIQCMRLRTSGSRGARCQTRTMVITPDS